MDVATSAAAGRETVDEGSQRVTEGSRLRVYAIRGATDVPEDEPAAIGAAVTRLVGEIMSRNSLSVDEIVSAIFTSTPDLTSTFPALPARQAGWASVPMIGATEVGVPDSLVRCIRVLVTVQRAGDRPAEHVYLGAAAALRPDLHRANRP